MSLENFITKVKTLGIARNNRYEASIHFPSAISIGYKDNETIRLFCHRVSMPGISLMTWEHSIYGEFRSVPYQKRFDPIMMAIYVDQQFDVKKAFDSWMHYIYDTDTRISAYYDDYVCRMNLDVYNVDEEEKAYRIKFYEVYPKAVQEIPLAAERRDAMELHVLLNYKYYEVEDL